MKTKRLLSFATINILLILFTIIACSAEKKQSNLTQNQSSQNQSLAGLFASQGTSSEVTASENVTPNGDTLITVIGVGDIMLGTNFPSDDYLPPHNGRFMMEHLKDILQNANITFGNLEGVLLTGDGKAKICNDPSICYAFKSPDHYIENFTNVGFDLLSIANNHINDFGPIGVANTVRLLEENNIHFAGTEDIPYTIFEKDSIIYGFTAFAPNPGTVNINDYENAKKIVKHLDSLCNVVIVSFHGGAEGAKHRNITREIEKFHGEDRGNPYEFARVVIDAGADIVFGHGPHVTRAIDLYKGRFIAYSLGNFATYARFNLRGVNGIAPIIKLKVSPTGEFQSGEIISVIQLGRGGPIIDSEKQALKEIINLTQTDIPEAPLIIQEDGIIKIK